MPTNQPPIEQNRNTISPVRKNRKDAKNPLPPDVRRPSIASVPSAPVGRDKSGPYNRTVRKIAQEPEIEGNNVILHRNPNFLVRTVNRTGQKIAPLRRRTGDTTLIPRLRPNSEQRIAESDTRMMPSVGPINAIEASPFKVPKWIEGTIVAFWLGIGILAHAFNMFNFPRYEPDEGTYIASAWAIVHGQLWPYAYGYGHPPAGWIQIAAWVQLIGGFFAFGNALNTGRVIMTIYAAGSSLLVYLIIRRLDGSRSAALLAMIVFSLSPLAITYARPGFLDNIATFWLLLSLYLLFVGNSRLPYIVLSALSFGIALLSKEVLLPFFPALLYALWLHTTRFQRKFAFIAFGYTVIAVGSTFVLLALLKGELFPTGWLPWDQHQHLSLLDTYLGQVARGQSEGTIGESWGAWTQTDQLIILTSIVATLFNLIMGWWKRKLLLLSLLAISFWGLLLRGGVIFPFYIIPLIPFLVFNIVMAIQTVARWLGKVLHFDWVRILLIGAVIATIIPYDLQQSTFLFTEHPTSVSNDALQWVRTNVPRNSMIVINSFFFTDLRESGGAGVGNGASYPYAHIYWNVAYDPEIHHTLLHDDWNRIDYIIADPAMLTDISNGDGQMQIIADALQHSALIKEFTAIDHTYQIAFKVFRVIHLKEPLLTSQFYSQYQHAPPMNIPASTAFLVDRVNRTRENKVQ